MVLLYISGAAQHLESSISGWYWPVLISILVGRFFNWEGLQINSESHKPEATGLKPPDAGINASSGDSEVQGLTLTCSSRVSEGRPLAAASGNRDIRTMVSSFTKYVCCNKREQYLKRNKNKNVQNYNFTSHCEDRSLTLRAEHDWTCRRIECQGECLDPRLQISNGSASWFVLIHK
jgi:hypothetical protein